MAALHDPAPFARLASSEAPDTQEIRARLVEAHAHAVDVERLTLDAVEALLKDLGVLRWCVASSEGQILASSDEAWEELDAEEGAVVDEAMRIGGSRRARRPTPGDPHCHLREHWRALRVGAGVVLALLPTQRNRP